MTTAEQLRAEGKAEGRVEGKAEGRVEGKAEGRVEGQAAMLIHQLTIKFGQLPPQIVSKVEAGDAAALERWSERVLTAASLEEVFG